MNSREKGSLRTATINSRSKGKRGERQWRDELRANGYHARRGQQFSGSPDSPDVICDGLPWAHFEVKHVEHLNLSAAMAQARRDQTKSGLNSGKAIFVAHRKNRWPWLVTMDAERFYRFLRRDLTGEWATRMAADFSPAAACGEVDWLRCATAGKRFNIHELMRQAQRDCQNDHLTSALTRSRPLPRPDGPPTARIPFTASQAVQVSPKGGEGVGRCVAVVAHQDRDGRWLVTMTAETFFKFLGGALPPENKPTEQTKQQEQNV